VTRTGIGAGSQMKLTCPNRPITTVARARVGGGERGGVADVVFGGGIGITATDQVGTRSR